MRGKLFNRILPKIRERITPADAGKTIRRLIYFLLHGDHPRGCGENFPDEPVFPSGDGSPPRMRGKLRTGDYAYVAVRITPADAGKTDYRGDCRL